MAVFSDAIKIILAAEKEYSTKSSDYGGETKYGISKRAFPDIDIFSLTVNQAMNLIERNYWQPYRLEEINNQDLANRIILLFINMNPAHAAAIIQCAINACGDCNKVPIAVDGVLGSKSIQVINSLPVNTLLDKIRLTAIGYYLSLTDKDSSQIINFRGWVRRALL